MLFVYAVIVISTSLMLSYFVLVTSHSKSMFLQFDSLSLHSFPPLPKLAIYAHSDGFPPTFGFSSRKCLPRQVLPWVLPLCYKESSTSQLRNQRTLPRSQ